MKALNDYTIKEIETLLNQLDRFDEQLFTDLSQDSRKGVQKLVQKKIRQLQAMEQANAERYARLRFERELWSQGYHNIAGVDEVGRGPLAGPVYAAAVILPHDFSINGINDSKQLSHDKRINLSKAIKSHALAYCIAEASVAEIDQLNIKNASRLAMKRAIDQLSIQPDYVLVDAETIRSDIPQKALIKGDALSYSIASASIIAKVARDELMLSYDKQYPSYDFKHNMGYGTKNHLVALAHEGITPIHRKSFAPVKKYLS